MKACKYCANGFEDDQIEMHQQICAKNPDVNEKQRKAGELEALKKTCVLTDGVITRMYWAHSTGESDFTDEIPRIQEVWKQTWPDRDHTSLQFLRERGFQVRTMSQ